MARKKNDVVKEHTRGTYQKREDILPKVDGILKSMAGGASLRKACNEAEVAHNSFIDLVMDDKDIFDRYARARKAQAEWLFDSIGMIEDGTLAGKIDPQAAKVVIESRKWRLAKLHPKEYGDKSQVDMISSDGSMATKPATMISFADLTPEERTDIARKLFTGK